MQDIPFSAYSIQNNDHFPTSFLQVMERMTTSRFISEQEYYNNSISYFTPCFNAQTNKASGLVVLSVVGKAEEKMEFKNRLIKYNWVIAVFDKYFHMGNYLVDDLYVIGKCDTEKFEESHISAVNILRKDGFIVYGTIPNLHRQIYCWPDRFIKFKK